MPFSSSGHAAHSVSRLSVIGLRGAVHTIIRLHKEAVKGWPGVWRVSR